MKNYKDALEAVYRAADAAGGDELMDAWMRLDYAVDMLWGYQVLIGQIEESLREAIQLTQEGER